VAGDRSPHDPSYRETDPRRGGFVAAGAAAGPGRAIQFSPGQRDGDRATRSPAPSAQSSCEIPAMPQPGIRGQHSSGSPQAESRLRPLSRRAATIVRPARVRIRNRKPCVRARRRLFGWNVRLLTADVSEDSSGRSQVRSFGHRNQAIDLSTLRSTSARVNQAASDMPIIRRIRCPACGQQLVEACGALLAFSFSPVPPFANRRRVRAGAASEGACRSAHMVGCPSNPQW